MKELPETIDSARLELVRRRLHSVVAPPALAATAGGEQQVPDVREPAAPEIAGCHPRSDRASGSVPEFSLLFFASNEAEYSDRKYGLLTDAARFADRHGFRAIWLPERHFHAFGGLYPSPSVLAAALATLTQHVRLRAGSVVLPLQNPLRVAEEWAVVDNLSGGRVDLAFAQGWNARDFVLAPHAYANRLQLLHEGIKLVQSLWQGESVELPDGAGARANVRIYPQPRQKRLETWVTCSGGAQRFTEAGALGANVLTALLFQSVDELAEKIGAYRRARREHGHEGPGHVTLMLHSFIGETIEAVKAAVRAPFTEYLLSSIDLWRQQSEDLRGLSAAEREEVLAYAFERYFETAALFGTPASCRKLIERLHAIGVAEIACLIDFGVARDEVLHNLTYLAELHASLDLAAA
jgi:natural product biosynthesis luciferase-like monooxygenase protein